MPRRRIELTKPKRVKAVARKRIGTPKPARPLDERQLRDKPKYKIDWGEAVSD